VDIDALQEVIGLMMPNLVSKSRRGENDPQQVVFRMLKISGRSPRHCGICWLSFLDF
jgi:hypothetical protein